MDIILPGEGRRGGGGGLPFAFVGGRVGRARGNGQ